MQWHSTRRAFLQADPLSSHLPSLSQFRHEQLSDDDNPIVTAITVFSHWNEATRLDEVAGEINWDQRQSTGTISFGHLPARNLREMRKEKTPGKSKCVFSNDAGSVSEAKLCLRSRRFTWNDHQYKWKRGVTPNDLQVRAVRRLLPSPHRISQCFSITRMIGSDKLIANYDSSTQTLTIEARGEEIIDQIVVLCVVHLVRSPQETRSCADMLALPNSPWTLVIRNRLWNDDLRALCTLSEKHSKRVFPI